MQKLLDVKQVADLLGLKESTIYAYICKRKIPFVKIGSRVLFHPAKLEAWVAQNSIDSINN